MSIRNGREPVEFKPKESAKKRSPGNLLFFILMLLHPAAYKKSFAIVGSFEN
jgi:hypothetical protein